MSDWWEAIEAEIDQRGEAAEDPWADVFDDDAELTPDQLGFLTGLADQPPVLTLDESVDPE